jgi:hypothetical protein
MRSRGRTNGRVAEDENTGKTGESKIKREKRREKEVPKKVDKKEKL